MQATKPSSSHAPSTSGTRPLPSQQQQQQHRMQRPFPEVRCNKCHKPIAGGLFVSSRCDCLFCAACAYDHFVDHSACPTCRTPLEVEDLTELYVAPNPCNGTSNHYSSKAARMERNQSFFQRQFTKRFPASVAADAAAKRPTSASTNNENNKENLETKAIPMTKREIFDGVIEELQTITKYVKFVLNKVDRDEVVQTQRMQHANQSLENLKKHHLQYKAQQEQKLEVLEKKVQQKDVQVQQLREIIAQRQVSQYQHPSNGLLSQPQLPPSSSSSSSHMPDSSMGRSSHIGGAGGGQRGASQSVMGHAPPGRNGGGGGVPQGFVVQQHHHRRAHEQALQERVRTQNSVAAAAAAVQMHPQNHQQLQQHHRSHPRVPPQQQLSGHLSVVPPSSHGSTFMPNSVQVPHQQPYPHPAGTPLQQLQHQQSNNRSPTAIVAVPRVIQPPPYHGMPASSSGRSIGTGVSSLSSGGGVRASTSRIRDFSTSGYVLTAAAAAGRKRPAESRGSSAGSVDSKNSGVGGYNHHNNNAKRSAYGGSPSLAFGYKRNT